MINVSHLYRCEVFVSRGIDKDAIRFNRSKHQTNRFKRRLIGNEAGILGDASFRSILVPHRRTSVKILQQLHSSMLLRNLCERRGRRSSIFFSKRKWEKKEEIKISKYYFFNILWIRCIHLRLEWSVREPCRNWARSPIRIDSLLDATCRSTWHLLRKARSRLSPLLRKDCSSIWRTLI